MWEFYAKYTRFVVGNRGRGSVAVYGARMPQASAEIALRFHGAPTSLYCLFSLRSTHNPAHPIHNYLSGDSMFAVLQIKDKRSLALKSKIQSQRVTLPNGEAFFIVTVEKSFGRVPWKKLESCMGILCKDVLLADGATLPSNCGITEFKADILPRLLLINSAADYLSGKRFGSLTVFDERGIYGNCIKRLISSFDFIRVVTPDTEKYSTVISELMVNYGFSLLVSSEESFESDVVIAYDGNVPLHFSGLVFMQHDRYMMNAQVFWARDIVLPEIYDRLRSRGVDSLQFASALYEKCRVEELSQLRFNWR